MKIAALQMVSRPMWRATRPQPRRASPRPLPRAFSWWPCGNLLPAGAQRPRQAGHRRGRWPGPDPAHAGRGSSGTGCVVGGTLPIPCARFGHVFNACGVWGPDGRRVARYDKIPPFAFDGRERYDGPHAAGGRPGGGRRRRPAHRPVGVLRPALSRAVSRADAATVPPDRGALGLHPQSPARRTGSCCCALGRDREPGYVLAPAQGGHHENGRRNGATPVGRSVGPGAGLSMKGPPGHWPAGASA